MRKSSLLAAYTASIVVAGSIAAQPVVSEGTGQRRTDLDRMTFKPAPLTEMMAASDWIGTKPSAADMSGNPVLILTWAEWYRPSHAVAMLGQRLADEFADEGLIVIGVHDGEGWDEAQRFASQRKLGYPMVRDEAGSIRKALMVDQDPDIYVIDRAGQLRFADITTESARQAVSEVVGEDADAASTVQDRLARQAAEAEQARRRPSGISDTISFADLPSIAFAPPTPEEYAKANWPKAPVSDDRNRGRGESGPVALALPPDGWYRDRVPNPAGKLVIAYNWHPADRDSMDTLMYRMDDLQRQLARDVIVVGIMPPFGDSRSGRQTDPIQSIEVSPATIERYIGNRQLEHYLVASPSGSPIPAIDNGGRRNVAVTGAVSVVSTDGMVRRTAFWRDWDDIRQAVDTMLRVDPGVKARRSAEEAYIRGRK